MDNPSFGSGSSLLGGTSALAQVMAQRSQGGSAQVSPSAPTAGSNPMPASSPTGPSPVPQGLPGGSSAPAGPDMSMMGTATGNVGPAVPIDSTEAKIIIQALTTRLKALSDMQKGPEVQGGM